MRAFLICLLLISITIFAQDKKTSDKKKKAAKTEKTAESTESGDKASIESGVGSLPWESNFDTVKEGVKGTLKYYEENKIIVSQEGEITYTYGFFYKDPEMLGEEEKEESTKPDVATGTDGESEEGTAKTADEDEAQFSYVIMQFPYLKMDDIKKKYVEKYGDPASDNVSKNRGVIIWESESTMITLWIDSYEDEPYCRKINYVSKKALAKWKDYKEKIFNKKEMKALDGIEP